MIIYLVLHPTRGGMHKNGGILMNKKIHLSFKFSYFLMEHPVLEKEEEN